MNDTTQTIRFGADVEQAGTSTQMAPLICFYLLVAQLITTQSDPAVQLPTMTSPLAAREQPAELVVNLREDGHVIVGGQSLTLDAFRATLAADLARADQSLRVVIRADRRQSYRRLHELLDVCRNLDVRHVILRAQGGEQ